MLKKYLFTVLLLFFFVSLIQAQEDNGMRYINAKARGLQVSYGYTYYNLSEWTNVGESGTPYHPILLQAYFHNPLYETKNHFNVSVEFLPQINLVFFNSNVEFELGVNVFFDFSFELSKKAILSFNIGSGPHFITVESTKQAKGYLFSDNFILAYKRKFSNDIELSIHSGYRHMSNASIKSPNNGIDNILVGVGFSKLITKR
ncbi:MAG TPA: hypothetical protein DDX39_12460 [Bacteroidales bacterium]|nr:MAG: hypothetical protein A2W98_11865 [Bacteroidetes bacterium GWF2_33_38]OFY76466.1 MAG: hypothetical protein A2265_07005 [Bacteroidetes bacterium RIFOXYA12_FULL_33_9]OFY85141.1 MAG: hypothetical protein A2236_12265 [Bacteroidetes bacterium RIFOXYA2_FULL_33_7]HBF89445.1 hypothetical protein [Bacteroidales bacterium]